MPCARSRSKRGRTSDGLPDPFQIWRFVERGDHRHACAAVAHDGIRPAAGLGRRPADAVRDGDGVFGLDRAAGFAQVRLPGRQEQLFPGA
nr:hypothetical protein [Tanacetum cinerariifolium]